MTPPHTWAWQVQAGGNFDVDWLVKDPTGAVIHSGNGEKEGDFIFAVDRPGEYTFCFSNAMSTFAEKTVTFDITLATDAKPKGASAAAKPAIDDVIPPIEQSLGKVRESLVKIERSIRHYKIREKVRPARVRRCGTTPTYRTAGL